MNVVILGSQGMLGQELEKAFQSDQQFQVSTFDLDTLDVTNFELLSETIAQLKPDVVFNTVAYNAVDRIEESSEELEKGEMLNAKLPGYLAKLSNKLYFILVHYSSDYIFDGTLAPPKEKKCQGACCGGNCHGNKQGYDESSLPNPLSKYGETKYRGERAVMENSNTYYIIRLSKLFGKPALSHFGKKSFFETMLELGKAQNEVSAVDGEMSCFTYAPDLALATKDLIVSESEYGIYHLINEGAVTWYEGVSELYRQAGITTHVKPLAPDLFPRSAKRPAFSVLINTKRPKLRHYSQALADFLKNNND